MHRRRPFRAAAVTSGRRSASPPRGRPPSSEAWRGSDAARSGTGPVRYPARGTTCSTVTPMACTCATRAGRCRAHHCRCGAGQESFKLGLVVLSDSLTQYSTRHDANGLCVIGLAAGERRERALARPTSLGLLLVALSATPSEGQPVGQVAPSPRSRQLAVALLNVLQEHALVLAVEGRRGRRRRASRGRTGTRERGAGPWEQGGTSGEDET